MKRLIPLIFLLLSFGLSGCGGDDAAESTSVPSGSVPSAPEAQAKPANNPLAAEQKLIKDAEALQGILNKDADRKKQAVNDSN